MTSSRELFQPQRRSRTIPTRCPYCGAKVFFYTDEYGSKVFFDELGPPWPKHSCSKHDADTAFATSTVTGPVGRFVHVGGHLIHESEYASRVIAGASKRKKWKPPIVSIQPEKGGEEVSDYGVLREIVPQINVFKKLQVEKRTKIASKLFGYLLDTDWAQVSIHVDDLAEDEIRSYTMLIMRDDVSSIDLRKGCVVRFTAQGEKLPFRKPIWICREIDKAWK